MIIILIIRHFFDVHTLQYTTIYAVIDESRRTRFPRYFKSKSRNFVNVHLPVIFSLTCSCFGFTGRRSSRMSIDDSDNGRFRLPLFDSIDGNIA